MIKFINNEELRNKASQEWNKLPKYFFEVGASSSGKYHPEFAKGYGGLVRHTEMAVKIGLDLLRSEMYVEDTKENQDKIVIALMFHDGRKYGAEDTPTEKLNLNHESDMEMYLEPIFGKEISSLIGSHMGKWGERKPMTELEKLVHIADYMASRKYVAYGVD